MLVMSIEATLEILSENSGQTENIAQNLSKLLKAGDSVELVSDLGGGKTVFAKGLAKGLGYKGRVSSPSFTLVNQYVCPKGLIIYHYDFYRLADPGLIKQTLVETLGMEGAINVVEWPQSVNDVMPDKSIKVSLEYVKGSYQKRKIKIITDKRTAESLKLKV